MVTNLSITADSFTREHFKGKPSLLGGGILKSKCF